MSFLSTDWRNRRNLFGIGPAHYPIVNYCTNAQEKSEMRNLFGEDIFLNNLHLIPDPLKKNLADTMVNQEKVTMDEDTMDIQPKVQHESTLAGITNFFTGILNVVSSAMFRKSKSAVNGFDGDSAPENWQDANSEFKNGLNQSFQSDDLNVDYTSMSDCQTAAENCEQKLNKVRQLLSSKNGQNPPRPRQRRPKWIFVEPNCVDDYYEDAFSPEDFVNLANNTFIDYISPMQYQNQEYFEVDAPKMKLEPLVLNLPNYIQTVPEINVESVKNSKNDDDLPNTELKNEIVASCEDKLSKLKALLQNRCKNNTKTVLNMDNNSKENVNKDLKPTKSIPISKSKDKRFKNLHRLPSDKRHKMKLKQSIQEDLLFANEVYSDVSSVENSPSFHSLESISENMPLINETPKEFFDEISGRFRTASVTSSDDSFQIVFNDTPKRFRSNSDCDSEDSFIVFEDSPDSCYTSNDVFGDSDSECSDSDSDCSDSGCVNLQMSCQLSRTVSDLTDDRLYDEVDFAKVLPNKDDQILDLKADRPVKKQVRFSTQPPKVHVMRVWAFAAKQARAGQWEQYALDRERFKRRIADVDVAVSWVLKPQHRSRVVFQRFMPWWNAEKRREIAEKKQKDEEESKRREEKKYEIVEQMQEFDKEELRRDADKLQQETSRDDFNAKMGSNECKFEVGLGSATERLQEETATTVVKNCDITLKSPQEHNTTSVDVTSENREQLPSENIASIEIQSDFNTQNNNNFKRENYSDETLSRAVNSSDFKTELMTLDDDKNTKMDFLKILTDNATNLIVSSANEVVKRDAEFPGINTDNLNEELRVGKEISRNSS